MNQAVDTGWIARRGPGGIFCAPRCGGNCTQADHDAAVAKANALVAKLGDGWEAIIWENMGWHYRVVKGLFEITTHRDGSFMAWYQGEQQFTAHAETSEDALGFLRQDMRTTIRRLENDLADAA